MRAILTMAALFAAAVGSFLFYQYRLAEHEPKDGPPTHQDSAPPTVAQPLDAPPALPTQMLWKVDPRWQAAESEGKPLLEEIRELYRWQEEEGGDPLRFRTEGVGERPPSRAPSPCPAALPPSNTSHASCG